MLLCIFSIGRGDGGVCARVYLLFKSIIAPVVVYAALQFQPVVYAVLRGKCRDIPVAFEGIGIAVNYPIGILLRISYSIHVIPILNSGAAFGITYFKVLVRIKTFGISGRK